MKRNIASMCVLVLAALMMSALSTLVAKFVLLENQEYLSDCCPKWFSTLCKYLSMHPDDDHLTFERHRKSWTFSVNEEGQYICATDNLTNIVQQYTEKHSRTLLAMGLTGPHYLACGNRSLARQTGDLTAYFNRISPHQNVTEDNLQTKIQWDKRSEHSFIDLRFLYHNGEITVPETRIYSVYASVIFSILLAKSNQQRISVRICRRVYDYEGTLFGETELIPTGNGKIYTSLRVGGQLLLNKGDVLLVRVSSARDLIWNSTGNTFVIFPML